MKQHFFKINPVVEGEKREYIIATQLMREKKGQASQLHKKIHILDSQGELIFAYPSICKKSPNSYARLAGCPIFYKNFFVLQQKGTHILHDKKTVEYSYHVVNYRGTIIESVFGEKWTADENKIANYNNFSTLARKNQQEELGD